MSRAQEIADLLAGVTITTADNNAQLVLKSTDADASVGPLLQLHRDSASPADDDAMGTIDFRGENSASEIINYVRINTRSADVTDGTEDAKFDVNTYVAGASVNRFSMTPTETVFNEDSVDVDFRVEGNGDANLLYVDAGNDRIGIGTSSPASIFHVKGADPEVIIQDTNDTGDAFIKFKNGSGTQRGFIQTAMTSDVMLFGTSATERFRLDAQGRFLLNTQVNYVATSSARSQIKYDKASEFGLFIRPSDNNTGGGNPVLFQNLAGGTIGSISADASNVAYNTSSDYRLKTEVNYDWDATTRLKQLKPARFKWIADGDDAEFVDGFIAHELSTIVPISVTGIKDAVAVWNQLEIDNGDAPDGVSVGDNKLDDDGNTIPIMQGIDQSKLVPLLCKTILELEARIAAIEAN